MRAAPLRFLDSVLWPASIWTSLTHLEEHPADDYVERTSPIVATAIAFWIGALGLVALWATQGAVFGGVDVDGVGQSNVHLSRRSLDTLTSVLWVFLPVVYVAGFWMFTARDEKFPR